MLSSRKVQRGLSVVLVALVAAIAVVILTGGHTDHGGQALAQATSKSSQFDGPTMPAGLKATDFTLTDQNGHSVSLAKDRGHVVILTFIHSKCHDACPFMTQQIKGALNDLPGRGANIPTIGVSVDHLQDTEASRRTFLHKMQMTGRMHFVNGSLTALRKIWKAYGIAPETPRTEHSAFVLLIDKRGYERVGFAADQLTPPALAHDIRVLEREPA